MRIIGIERGILSYAVIQLRWILGYVTFGIGFSIVKIESIRSTNQQMIIPIEPDASLSAVAGN